MSSSKLRVEHIRTIVVVGMMILGLAGGVVLGMMGAAADEGVRFDSSPMTLALVSGIAAIFAVGCFLGGAWWMKALDEAAQEAHKWAWYWGGSVGLTMGMAGILVLMTPMAAEVQFATIISGRTDPAAYLVTGAFAVTVPMMIGYMAAWALWWWRHR